MTFVKLNIKSPTHGVADKEFTVDLDSTVLSLKTKIESDWSNHPTPKDQRLVYAGKLLDDNHVWNEVLRLGDARDDNDAFTIHLICRMSSPTSSPKNPTTSAKESSSTLRQRNVGNVRYIAETDPWRPVTDQLPSNYSTANLQPEDQAYIMQQMYATYMNQYMQYLQSVGMWTSEENVNNDVVDVGFNTFSPVAAAAVAGAVANNVQVAGVENVNNVEAVNNVEVINNNVNAAVNNANAVNNVNAVVNAGAGGLGGAMEADDDDDLGAGGNRDWLDWFYVASRVLILFSLVYLYSSLARFTMVAGLVVVLFLYNNNFFGNNNNNNDNQNRQEAAVEVVRQAQEHNQQQQQQQNVDEPVVDPVPENPGFFGVVSTILVTFFTSLFPNAQQIPA